MAKLKSHWIKKERRLAIYLRDGLACCYCGLAIEDGIQLTLDHLTPRSQEVDNRSTNLVTACGRCNSVRGDREYTEFAHDSANYLGISAPEVIAHIKTTAAKPLDMDGARQLLEARGSVFEAINSIK